MIYIFDLDDTLYDERQYVESGLRAVSVFAEKTWGIDKKKGFADLVALIDTNGRGHVFNDFLSMHHIAANKKNVSKCVSAYRLHKPSIFVPDEHLNVLDKLPNPLYLVTDGNKIVQSNKVSALGVTDYFKRIFITHRFGIKHSKPSTYCFQKIKQLEQCEWNQMTYIGDNPAKDFVNLNKLGMTTIRVLTGVHRMVKADPGFDAKFTIQSLRELTSLTL